MPLFKHSDVDALHVRGPKLSSDPAAWLHPTLRAHMSFASHKGPLTCVYNTEELTSTPREAFAPSTSNLLSPGQTPSQPGPTGLKVPGSSTELTFKCSLSPSVSLLTCKTGRCALFGMDSVRGVHSVMRVEFRGQSQMLNTRWLCGLWSCKKT